MNRRRRLDVVDRARGNPALYLPRRPAKLANIKILSMRKERAQWLVKCRNSRRFLSRPHLKSPPSFSRAFLRTRDPRVPSDYFIVLRTVPPSLPAAPDASPMGSLHLTRSTCARVFLRRSQITLTCRFRSIKILRVNRASLRRQTAASNVA